jgi:PTH1 family peptidyl-tRNA hydrolase
VEPDHVIAVHDELDIPFDSIKLKQGGGHGGHNGIRDIAAALKTPEFSRVRVGIGRPPGRQDPADFVLKDFAGTEREQLPMLVSDGADAVELLVSEGLLAAQTRFHGA